MTQIRRAVVVAENCDVSVKYWDVIIKSFTIRKNDYQRIRRIKSMHLRKSANKTFICLNSASMLGYSIWTILIFSHFALAVKVVANSSLGIIKFS